MTLCMSVSMSSCKVRQGENKKYLNKVDFSESVITFWFLYIENLDNLLLIAIFLRNIHFRGESIARVSFLATYANRTLNDRKG